MIVFWVESVGCSARTVGASGGGMPKPGDPAIFGDGVDDIPTGVIPDPHSAQNRAVGVTSFPH